MIKNSNLKERLRRYLDVKGMKTAELARITGIVPNSLSDLMTGKKKGMNSDQVEIIIKTTDVNPLFLLTGEGPVIRSVNAQHLDGPTAEEITVAALAVEGSTTRFCLLFRPQAQSHPTMPKYGLTLAMTIPRNTLEF